MTTRTLSIDEIRAALPVTQQVAYLNTGTFGPLPRVAAEAAIARERRDLEQGRFGMAAFEAQKEQQAGIRRMLAAEIGAGEDEVALTRGTSNGVNFAVWGLNWREGDEIVTTSLEHIGGIAAAYFLQERLGVRLRIAACGDGSTALEAIRAELSPRTRAVVYLHVAWSNGHVLPVADIAEAAHRAGAVAIVDAAQSAGAIAVDVKALGVDAYALPGQKWLCGPGGTGGLYVNTAVIDQFHGSFGAYPSFASFTEQGEFTMWPNAHRFEEGLGNGALIGSWHAALAWVTGEVERAWAYARAVEIADYARGRLAAVPGVRVTTPAGTPSGLTHFTLAGADLAATVDHLAERGVVIRSIAPPHQPAGLRVSTGFYNTREDVDRLIAGLESLPRA